MCQGDVQNVIHQKESIGNPHMHHSALIKFLITYLGEVSLAQAALTRSVQTLSNEFMRFPVSVQRENSLVAHQ